MDWIAFAQGVTALILFSGIIAGAAVYVKSSVQRQRHEELKDLADTRGQRVEDLERDVRHLEGRVAELEGELRAYRSLLEKGIAHGVAQELIPLLNGACPGLSALPQ